MSVPNFLDKLTGKKADEPKSFLALVLSDNRVQAAVWKVVATQTEIISLGTPVEWDGEVATTNELIQAVDATISSATEGLELEPDEVILGLANNWVENAGIKASKKDLIKSICRELSLQAIGYVVISDTIVKYLKMQEGTPPTSILIQIDRSRATLSLVELGHIKYTVSVGVSDNICSDVAEGLSQLPKDAALPSRFIVVSAMENTSDIVQTLTAYDWLDSFAFLHTPKIEALPKDVEVHATAVAGGSEVAASLGFSLDVPQVDPTPATDSSTQEAAAPANPVLLSPEEVGFAPAPPSNSDELSTPEEPEDLVESVEVDEVASKPRFHLPIPKLPSITLPHFSHFKLPSISGRPIYPILLILLVLIGGGALALFTIPRATITITVSAKPITESLALTLSSSISTVDSAAKKIPATYKTQEISGEDSVSVTGQKTIGDPARGEVTIYNRTTLAKTFLKGTSLAAGTLKFTLDSDVTVASKSAGADYVDVPGKAKVKITAASFGEAGNLKADTEFLLASFSKDSYVAKNESALTGGNAKDITVVSDADKKNLAKALSTKLSSELEESLKLDTSMTESHYVLEDDVKITSEKYSHKVGEEATTLTGELTLEIGTLTYNQGDIQELIKDAINQAVPQGYLRADITPSITLSQTTVTDSGDVNATAEVTLYVTPSLDTTNLATLLKGKKYNSATTILSSLPGVVGSDIKLSPNLPPRLLSLPYNPSHITIAVQAVK